MPSTTWQPCQQHWRWLENNGSEWDIVSLCKEGLALENVARILLVEDDARDVELTLEALGEYGLAGEVAVARDGAEALDYIHRHGPFTSGPDAYPALILLDLNMPKLDGVEVARRLKGDPQTRSIPIVVLTSSAEPCDLHACYECGVNAYVVKPVQFQAYLDALRGLTRFWAVLNEPPLGRSDGQRQPPVM
jgi:CheY-like chemotaxis protein